MDTRAGQPPEGRLIEEARERLDISQNAAAKLAGMSGTRWRQIVYGEASGGKGIKNPVYGNAETVARMAQVVDLTPRELRDAGRADAADELEENRRQEAADTQVKAKPDAYLQRVLDVWPRLLEWQRDSVAGIAEQFVADPARASAAQRPEQEHRRTG